MSSQTDSDVNEFFSNQAAGVRSILIIRGRSIYPGLGSAKVAEPSWAKFFAVPFGTPRKENEVDFWKPREEKSVPPLQKSQG
jgi:hypothetical protein